MSSPVLYNVNKVEWSRNTWDSDKLYFNGNGYGDEFMENIFYLHV